jgi:hypothetical protein
MGVMLATLRLRTRWRLLSSWRVFGFAWPQFVTFVAAFQLERIVSSFC